MSDEDRKRIIDEALHGAKVGPETRPKPPTPAPAVTPCCDHCIIKMGKAPTMQPVSANPYSPYAGSMGIAPYQIGNQTLQGWFPNPTIINTGGNYSGTAVGYIPSA